MTSSSDHDLHRSKAGRLKVAAEPRSVPHHDDRGAIRIEVDTGGREHVLRADSRDRGPITVQLVVGEFMDDQAGQGPGHLRGRLEAQREDADQVVAGGLQLILGDGRSPGCGPAQP